MLATERRKEGVKPRALKSWGDPARGLVRRTDAKGRDKKLSEKESLQGTAALLLGGARCLGNGEV